MARGMQHLIGAPERRVEERMEVQWREITFKIDEKFLLEKVSGFARPGRVLAVMGPSGSGKTTLMEILSGRRKTTGSSRSAQKRQRLYLGGDVFVRGQKVALSYFKGRAAFVFQDNALYGTSTARECLNFSAFLRLDSSVSASKREELVDEQLERLHLTDCADTLSFYLSGGQRKRASVGCELVADPLMLLLDEPLSGLDSFNAFKLVETLKELANSGKPIVLTLHQPSAAIFQMVDDIMLLEGGKMIYFGPSTAVATYFAKLGFPCQPQIHPADHAMFVIQQADVPGLEKIKEGWERSDDCAALFKQLLGTATPAARDYDEDSDDSEESEPEEDESVYGNKRTCCETLFILVQRDLQSKQRTAFLTICGLFTIFVLALVYGWLFFRAGKNEDSPPDPNGSLPNCHGDNFSASQCQFYMQVHQMALVMVVMTMLYISTSNVINIFMQEQPCFLRERNGGYYGVLPYFFSKTIFDVLLLAAQSAIMVFTLDLLVGFRANPFVLVLETLLFALCSNSIMYCLCAVSSSPEQSQVYMTYATVPQFVFSGMAVPTRLIPTSLVWLKWICPFYHGVSMMSITEFGYVYSWEDQYLATHPDFDCTGNVTLTGEAPGYCVRIASLRTYDIAENHFWWPHLIMLVILCIAFRSLAAGLLAYKTRYVH